MLSSTLPHLLLLLCLYGNVSQAFPYDFGVVTPGDPFIFLGEGLTLFCNITDPTLRENSSFLYFERSSNIDDENVETVLIPTAYIQIVTSKAIRLHIPRMRLEDDGNYSCLQRTFRNKKDRLIGHQIVRVDHRPQKVETIDCLVYNWENMTCKWSLGVEYRHPEDLNVTLIWATDGDQMVCPELTSTSCGWPSADYQHSHNYIMIIQVKTIHQGKVLDTATSPQFTVETRHHKIASSTHEIGFETIRSVAILKPAPIQAFQATEENSTCIGLSWKHPSSQWRKKYYVGRYERHGSDNWTEINMNLMTKSDVETKTLSTGRYRYRMNVLVCQLVPFTSYRFNVSVLPYPEDSEPMAVHGNRSDWISVSATTREDVPGSSPPMCPSCYHIHRCDHPKNNTRCVRIYWGVIPVSERHGFITNYSVRLEAGGVLFPETLLNHEVTNANFTITDAESSIQLRAATSIGFSSSPSVITIPSKKAKKPFPPKDFFVQTDANQSPSFFRYYISWHRLDSYFKYSNISIVWCQRGADYYTCKGNIKTIPLPHDRVTHSFRPNLPVTFPEQISIGIATEAKIGDASISSGIAWASCIYHRGKHPKNRPENVRFSATQPTQGLTVQWDKSDCTKERVFVTGYRISICETIDATQCPNKTVQKQTEVTFSKLKIKKEYFVKVQAISLAGLGPPSDPINQTVQKSPYKNSDLNDTTSIVGVIVVSLVLVAIIVAVVVCFLRKRIKDAKRAMPFIPDPRSHGGERLTDKQPLNQTSRFQDRPLPEPPSAAQHYYGLNLNACMMNHGSRNNSLNRSSNNSSTRSNAGAASVREYHYLLPREDEQSTSQSEKESEGGSSSKSLLANSHRQQDQDGSASSRLAGYSLSDDVAFIPPYTRMTCDDPGGSGNGETGGSSSSRSNNTSDRTSSSAGYSQEPSQQQTVVGCSCCTNNDDDEYETPVTTPDTAELQKPQWTLHHQNTLPLRPCPPKTLIQTKGSNGGVTIGRINDNNQHPSSHNHQQQPYQPKPPDNFLSSFSTPSAAIIVKPQPPSSNVPPLPIRQPLKDNPPLNCAPPPPYQPIPPIHNSHIPLNTNPNTNTNSTYNDCDKLHNHSTHRYSPHDNNQPNGTFDIKWPQPEIDPRDSTTPLLAPHTIKPSVELHTLPFRIPPPPSYPPSPDPTSQIACGFDTNAPATGITSDDQSFQPQPLSAHEMTPTPAFQKSRAMTSENTPCGKGSDYHVTTIYPNNNNNHNKPSNNHPSTVLPCNGLTLVHDLSHLDALFASSSGENEYEPNDSILQPNSNDSLAASYPSTKSDKIMNVSSDYVSTETPINPYIQCSELSNQSAASKNKHDAADHLKTPSSFVTSEPPPSLTTSAHNSPETPIDPYIHCTELGHENAAANNKHHAADQLKPLSSFVNSEPPPSSTSSEQKSSIR